jgi:hypothetical protein
VIGRRRDRNNTPQNNNSMQDSMKKMNTKFLTPTKQ